MSRSMDTNILNNMEEKMLEGMTQDQKSFVQKLFTQNQVLSSRLQQAQEMIAYKRLDYLMGILNIKDVNSIAPILMGRCLKEVESLLFEDPAEKEE